MKLIFPNPSRSFDAAKNCVCFWGYDSAIEISFFVQGSALKKICPQMTDAEDSLLRAFDNSRQQIYKAADKVYSGGKRGSNSFAFVLSAKDF